MSVSALTTRSNSPKECLARRGIKDRPYRFALVYQATAQCLNAIAQHDECLLFLDALRKRNLDLS